MPDELSKIDTQGLSGPATSEEIAKAKTQKHKPMMVTPRRLFTPEYVKEMKILLHEVLDEREYVKKLEGPYDDPEPLPQSYFDTTGREYPVGTWPEEPDMIR